MDRCTRPSARLALLAGLLASATAIAQEGRPASPADANRDGVTSVVEFRAYLIERVPSLHGPMVDRIAERVDADADSRSIVVRTDVKGATLCAWKGLEMYEVTRTDANGHAVIPVPDVTRGEIVITLSGPSLNTVTKRLRIE